ncbi:MAG: amidohydrolase family protein [Solirubrobacterales bacterium]|nr:amidohydrolase family protein [Solirubrobacterales bacterium]
MTIVDAHHHLWDLDRRSYAFLEPPEYHAIARTFGPADLVAAVGRERVVQTVVIQAAPDVRETDELLDVAAATPLISAVVGWIDFDANDPAAHLERLLAHQSSRMLVGIRAMAQDHPRADWLSSDAVVRSAAAIGAAGLVCELLIRPRELAAAGALVSRLPSVSFVIDHAAKPPIASGIIDPWGTAIRALASSPNTACKISGLITEANWSSWTTAQIAPFVDIAADAFGEDRLLFGSDWPVCLLAGSYSDPLEVARQTLGGLSPDKIFAANARRTYGLRAPVSQ